MSKWQLFSQIKVYNFNNSTAHVRLIKESGSISWLWELKKISWLRMDISLLPVIDPNGGKWRCANGEVNMQTLGEVFNSLK